MEPQLRSQDLRDDPDLRRALMLEEFRAIRMKSAESRDNQQSIIQWSLAAVGVLVAGSLAGLREKPGQPFILVAAITFALVGPAILMVAFAIYLSELQRMSRAGRFLRERERALRRASDPDVLLEREKAFAKIPILWESLLADASFRKEYGSTMLGAVAVCLLFVSLTVASVATSVSVTWGAVHIPGERLTRTVLTVLQVVVLAAPAVLSLHAVKIGKRYY